MHRRVVAVGRRCVLGWGWGYTWARRGMSLGPTRVAALGQFLHIPSVGCTPSTVLAYPGPYGSNTSAHAPYHNMPKPWKTRWFGRNVRMMRFAIGITSSLTT